MLGDPLQSKPTWWKTSGCSATSAFFVFRLPPAAKESMRIVRETCLKGMKTMSSATLASNIKEEWNQATNKAREAVASVGEIANQAGCAVGAIASQAVCEVGRKADDLTASAGIGIQELGDRFSKNAPHSGVLGSASQAVARGVKDSGEYLEGAKLSGMTEDVEMLIRRNPIPAVLIAVGLGWFVAHKLRR